MYEYARAQNVQVKITNVAVAEIRYNNVSCARVQPNKLSVKFFDKKRRRYFDGLS